MSSTSCLRSFRDYDDDSIWLNPLIDLGNTRDPNSPDYRDELSQTHICQAALPRTLMAGTEAMRRAGRAYLPIMEAESDASYRARLKRTVLLNKFRDAIDGHASRIFSEVVTLTEDAPDIMKELARDVDLTGRSLHAFAKDVYTDSKVTGITYILADAPAQGSPQTLEAQRRNGNRPYLVSIPQEEFLGFRSSSLGGREVLTMVRRLEEIAIADGVYGNKTAKRVRILEPGRYQVFEQVDDSAWILQDEGPAGTDRILLRPFYTGRTGFMRAAPSLMDLANLNALHWDSSSDQRHILHFTRVPILFLKSSAGSTPDQMQLAASNMVYVEDPDADMKYVEANGLAIDKGRQDLTDLVEQMEISADEVLTRRSISMTATARYLDEIELQSTLQKEAIELQEVLTNAMWDLARLMGIPPNQRNEYDWKVTVNTETGLYMVSDTRVQALDNMRTRKDLSRRTYLERARQIGILDKDLDVDQELERIAEEMTSDDSQANSGGPTPDRGQTDRAEGVGVVPGGPEGGPGAGSSSAAN